jgi:inosine/xanthosine triphosphatase
MTIFVGSENPVKLKAVETAVLSRWPEAHIQGFEVESGVNSQPYSDQETREGSENRARNALQLGLSLSKDTAKDPVIGIGLEGGVFEFGDEMWSTVWISVIDAKTQQIFSANGARFCLPNWLAEKIREGEDMGPVMMKMVGRPDVNKQEGMIGVITGGVVTRAEEYGSIAKLAIGLWYGQHQLKFSKN